MSLLCVVWVEGRWRFLPSWVMQMEPHPMPTLRASTPASIRFLAWAAVTTATHTRSRVSDKGSYTRDHTHTLPCDIRLGLHDWMQKHVM